MAPDPEVPPGPDTRRSDYRTATNRSDAAEEAVGDAEDDLADAERTLVEHDTADGEQQLAERQEGVRAAEDAWHDRRHEAHAASEAAARARERLDGDDAG